MNGEIFERPRLGQRPPTKTTHFGDKRTPLKTNRPLGTRRRELAAGYSQDLFRAAVVEKHGWDCWLRRVLGTPCSGEIEGLHVFPKWHLIDEFPKGAIIFGDSAQHYKDQVEIEAGASVVSLDLILLDPSNGLPGCRGHHTQAGDTWQGVDVQLFPKCVGEFAQRYGLTWLDGVERRRVA